MERLNNNKTFREIVDTLKIKLIDAYIIRKFLGTFFFCLVLILTIAVVFDFAEKIDNFMEFHFEARYPEEQKNFYGKCNKRFAEKGLKDIKEVYEWLKEKL